jgi:Zn-dependent M28 family amino/carboxypeptidase
MKRWFWVGMVLIAALAVLSSWQRSPLPPQATPVDLVRPAIESPTVDAQRLLADLDALAYPRYAESDRAKARRYIVQSLQDAGWTVQEQAFGTDVSGVNIYAERQGSDRQAGTLLLGAHYDTVEQSPGADDNATSVATILEAARLLSSQTPRTLQLVLFDLEEAGLLGSQAYVDNLTQTADFRGAVILEMLGYACEEAGCQSYPAVLPIAPPSDRGNFLAVIGNQGHPALIQGFTNAPPLPPVFTLAVPTLGDFTPDLVRSDHAPFWKKGLGAVFVTDTANFRNPHYHQPTDDLNAIDREFFLGSAQVIVNAVTTLLQEPD